MARKIGPYKGQGGIGKKTRDADIKRAGSLPTCGVDKVYDYDRHKKAVATRDVNVLRGNRMPENKQP